MLILVASDREVLGKAILRDCVQLRRRRLGGKLKTRAMKVNIDLPNDIAALEATPRG